jgi:hypothetical protein
MRIVLIASRETVELNCARLKPNTEALPSERRHTNRWPPYVKRLSARNSTRSPFVPGSHTRLLAGRLLPNTPCAAVEALVVKNQHTISETVSASHTSDPFVRIRILALPAGKFLEGIVDVGRFKVGEVYEVGPRLAELLIALGHAALERRRADSGRTGAHLARDRRRAGRTGGDTPDGR